MSVVHNIRLELSPRELYTIKLYANQENYIEITDNVFAVLDHESDGSLRKKYVIVQRLLDIEEGQVSFSCSCDVADCFHVSEVENLWGTNFILPEEEDFECRSISEKSDKKLFGVYSKKYNTYSIVSQTAKVFICQSISCKNPPRSCDHYKVLTEFFHMPANPPQNPQLINTDPINFKSFSKTKIPYPFVDEDRNTFLSNSYGNTYPTKLVPAFDPSNQCEHGHLFNENETIEMKSRAKIRLPAIDIECEIHYRPSTGGCNCHQYFDGREEHLLNVDNIYIFPYTWLIEILHNTQETRFPLFSAYKSAKRTRLFVGDKTNLPRYFNDKLRIAYNCFIRLLDLSFEETYRCEECSSEDGVKTVVMDGTAIGCQQRVMPNSNSTYVLDEQIHGSTLEERKFGLSTDIKELLRKYTNLSKKGYSNHIEMMEDLDYENLCDLLSVKPSLQTVVIDAGNPCPKSVQHLIGDLSRMSPTCGIIQVNGQHGAESLGILENIVSGAKMISTLDYQDQETLKKSCPEMFVHFLLSDEVPEMSVIGLLKDILSSAMAPFQGNARPSSDMYAPISNSHELFECFPMHPQTQGSGNYACNTPREDLTTGCNKDSKRHAKLTPGLFCMFCQHGVCLGFELMRLSESPRTAFDVLVRRFSENMPSLVIYDNACKLHLYALKREPQLFKNTRFMVDRFHYKRGHVGCTLGYNMNQYSKDSKIKQINSQVCEQANADLRRLGTVISSMKPENAMYHIKLFLAIRNIDKLFEMNK